jgi:hypothetical protein
MAIYHLHVKVIGRKSGSSAVASAAYRSGSWLRDERLDRSHDFSGKRGVVHSEVMLPENAPEAWGDRERLWNDVEAFEIRKDAQLAREVEFAIPREMTQAQGIELARDFVRSEFVDRGMIADLNVHWDMAEDGLPKPHAHVMLTMRAVDENGFGQKVREWNRTEMVERWRERWAELANERLAELDIDARIDHRSLEAQGIALEPQSQIGAPAYRIEGEGIEAAERAEMHSAIARNNGERIIADPSVALDAITQQQSTFTQRDMAKFAHRHSDGIDQFNEVVGAMRSARDLVELGQDGRGEDRFTTRNMIEAEQRLHHAAELMAERQRHEVNDADGRAALARAEQRGLVLSGEQSDALGRITDGRDLGVLVGHAGTGKSAMLGVAREAWESAGYEVRGAALSGIAAENLESGSGISSRTIASLASDYERADPVQSYADRRGITFRERVVEIVRKVMPEKVRDTFDGLRSPSDAPGPDGGQKLGREAPERDRSGLAAERRTTETPEREVMEDPEAALRKARTRALVRHARAVNAIFEVQEIGGKASPEQVKELQQARKAFEELRPHGSHDAEAAYKKYPHLAEEAASGNNLARVIRALQFETEIRINPNRLADRFVERWQRLDQTSQRQYQGGDMSSYRATRSAMGDMARGLERDPQMESILANRKVELGISFETGRRLSLELAFAHGLDLGRGRGIGI